VIKDHINSTLALVTEAGVIEERYAYTPWGKRVQVSNRSNADTRTNLLMDIGFTGHEHLDKFGLINMNGRMYDPYLGEFLSPDPFVQAPDNAQNFNRYAYCLNNPMMYTDPSGEIFWMPIIIGAVMGSASGYMIGNAKGVNGWDMAGYIVGGAIIGGLSGGSASGISAAGGGAMLAGAGAGAVGGAGFSGMATGWDGNAMLTGAINGAISGFVGGGVGGAIGGGWGALAGGASANLTSQLLYNDGDFSSINWASAGISAAISFGIYHATSYYNYKKTMESDFGKKTLDNLKYKSFARMVADYQKSRFWHKEQGGWILTDGTYKRFNPKNEYAAYCDVVNEQRPVNAKFVYHTHWQKAGVQYTYSRDFKKYYSKWLGDYTGSDYVKGTLSHQSFSGGDLNMEGDLMLMDRYYFHSRVNGVLNISDSRFNIRFFQFPHL